MPNEVLSNLDQERTRARLTKLKAVEQNRFIRECKIAERTVVAPRFEIELCLFRRRCPKSMQEVPE